MNKTKRGIAGIGAVFATALLVAGSPALADAELAATGLALPEMNAANGRALFASTGCVVCHSINGVGGVDAPMLDAEFMDQPMNPFDFAANMWRGAETMVQMQREELGDVIQISGQDLADIIALFRLRATMLIHRGRAGEPSHSM